MHTAHTLAELRQHLKPLGPCALVPTMGNLHAGHLALVKHAKAQGLPVVVSIFVNRLQFAPHEDFDHYPRTLAEDSALLAQVGASLLFAPSEAELYPHPQTCKVIPDPALSDILEGHFRPGFFTGVCTVVMKLFHCVQPHLAVFGKKDYQQLTVIRHMVQQLNLPIEIQGLDTERAPDGLALSSRNAYLSDTQRTQASALIQTLRSLGEQYRAQPEALSQLEAKAHQQLTLLGWTPDYLTIRRRETLLPPRLPDTQPCSLVSLGAARLGATRLIDNWEF
jgi:pantoate--beta-alanine ligase